MVYANIHSLTVVIYENQWYVILVVIRLAHPPSNKTASRDSKKLHQTTSKRTSTEKWQKGEYRQDRKVHSPASNTTKRLWSHLTLIQVTTNHDTFPLISNASKLNLYHRTVHFLA